MHVCLQICMHIFMNICMCVCMHVYDPTQIERIHLTLQHTLETHIDKHPHTCTHVTRICTLPQMLRKATTEGQLYFTHLQHTATHSVTHCNTLCNTLQHTLQHSTTHSATHSAHTLTCTFRQTGRNLQDEGSSITLTGRATHCNTLHHEQTATRCITMQHPATRCIMLQHTATHSATHFATHSATHSYLHFPANWEKATTKGQFYCTH